MRTIIFLILISALTITNIAKKVAELYETETVFYSLVVGTIGGILHSAIFSGILYLIFM